MVFDFMKDPLLMLSSIFILAALLMYLWRTLKTKGMDAAMHEAASIAYRFFLLAEKKLQLSGPEKMEWVAARFYPALPVYVKMLISEDQATQFLYSAYEKLRDVLKAEAEESQG